MDALSNSLIAWRAANDPLDLEDRGQSRAPVGRPAPSTAQRSIGPQSHGLIRGVSLVSPREQRSDRTVFERNVGIWNWDAVTGNVRYSGQWNRMLGCTGDEIKVDHAEWESRLHPEDRRRVVGVIQDCLEKELRHYFELRYRLRLIDNSYRHMIAFGCLCHHGHGGMPAFMWACHLEIGKDRQPERNLPEYAPMRGTLSQLINEQIGQYLVPHQSPIIAGFDIDGRAFPSPACIPSNMLDCLELADGTLGLIVGESGGHYRYVGAMSGLMCLRSSAEQHTNLDEIITHASSAICEHGWYPPFVSTVLAGLDPRSRTLRYVNVGFVPGYVLGGGTGVKADLQAGSTLPLGILQKHDIHVGGPIQLETNDIVVLTTNGIREARSADECFGTERMLQTIQVNFDRSAAEIIDILHRAVLDFTKGNHVWLDEFAIIVIKVGTPPTTSDK